MYSISENMNVFSTSKPSAIISLAFSLARRNASSAFRSFHRNFSSSVSWTTRGTSKTSCNHLRETMTSCLVYSTSYFKFAPSRQKENLKSDKSFHPWEHFPLQQGPTSKSCIKAKLYTFGYTNCSIVLFM